MQICIVDTFLCFLIAAQYVLSNRGTVVAVFIGSGGDCLLIPIPVQLDDSRVFHQQSLLSVLPSHLYTQLLGSNLTHFLKNFYFIISYGCILCKHKQNYFHLCRRQPCILLCATVGIRPPSIRAIKTVFDWDGNRQQFVTMRPTQFARHCLANLITEPPRED